MHNTVLDVQNLPVKSYQFHTKGSKKIPHMSLVWEESAGDKGQPDLPRTQVGVCVCGV